jgi:hypothetical protein
MMAAKPRIQFWKIWDDSGWNPRKPTGEVLDGTTQTSIHCLLLVIAAPLKEDLCQKKKKKKKKTTL